MVASRSDWENTLAATCRCLTEDLALPEHLCDDDLDVLRREPIINAFLDRRSVHPTGSEPPIQQLRPLLAYSLHSGRRRGTTWHQERVAVVWLLASHMHREGSPDDAYNYFERLHRFGRLLPTRMDASRVVAVREPRFDAVVSREIPAIRSRVQRAAGEIHEAVLGGRINVRVLYEDGDPGLLVVAVSTRVRPGAVPLPAEWLGIVLAGFFPSTPIHEIEGVLSLAEMPLRSDELGFCGLVEAK